MIKKISIVTPCYNEESNVEILYSRVKNVMKPLTNYTYEHIFIDNDSNDNTLIKLKNIANSDKNLKIIANARNFGHIRSPYYAMLQADGDAVISLVSDLQDPPELIVEFLKYWENGNKIVIGVKEKSDENIFMFAIRKFFYRLIDKISESKQIRNFTGFGLYDKSFIDVLKQLNEPYPYFRGIVAELGFLIKEVQYKQPIRFSGKTKNNFYTLYDIAMLGFISHSKIPLRMSSFIGFIVSFFSIFIALIYFIYKLFFWSNFQVGIAPLVIGFFFFGGVQLFFLGIIGEYISAIFTQVKNRPLVVEKERINF
jgi:glycosyltransferase involved in cell wall biosynthesis